MSFAAQGCGQLVIFDIVHTPRGPNASNVEVEEKENGPNRCHQPSECNASGNVLPREVMVFEGSVLLPA
jgi:hypothetical protein